MKQRILSLIIALAICVTSIPCMTANAQEDVGNNELSITELAGGEEGDDDNEASKYYILKGERLFFEDFESEDLIVAGPYHPAFGELVESLIFRDKIEDYIKKSPIKGNKIEFICNK